MRNPEWTRIYAQAHARYRALLRRHGLLTDDRRPMHLAYSRRLRARRRRNR